MCVCVCVSLDFRDLHPFKNFKEYPSRMVTDFIDRVRHLCTLRSLLFKVTIFANWWYKNVRLSRMRKWCSVILFHAYAQSTLSVSMV